MGTEIVVPALGDTFRRDWVQDVLDFHLTFAPEIVEPLPTVPAGNQHANYCLGFIQEELEETRRAMGMGDLPGVADGLVDLIYVAIRAALIWGIDLRLPWDAVHDANMRKVGGVRRADGKLEKPADFVPVDLLPILATQEPLRSGRPGGPRP